MHTLICGKSEGQKYLETQKFMGRILLKWIFRKQSVLWIEFIWRVIRTCGGLWLTH